MWPDPLRRGGRHRRSGVLQEVARASRRQNPAYRRPGLPVKAQARRGCPAPNWQTALACGARLAESTRITGNTVDDTAAAGGGATRMVGVIGFLRTGLEQRERARGSYRFSKWNSAGFLADQDNSPFLQVQVSFRIH